MRNSNGVIVAGALGAALAWALHASARVPDAIGADAPRARRAMQEHVLRTLDGRTFTLESLRGEVVLINFWASWCAPCCRELPRLNALHAEIAGKGGRVVAVSVDREARNVRRFVRRYGLTLPVCHDGPDGLARKLGLQRMPLTLVLSRDGEVAFAVHGADDETLAAVAARTRALIAAKPVASRQDEGGTP
jgi:thiol-disulfide isomerase/thioredoxin